MTDELNLISKMYALSDAEELRLPSGRYATVTEMTGSEQRNFMNRTKLMSGVAIQELLSACVATIDDEPLPPNPEDRQRFLLDMLSGDRATLVFNIRRHSLGNDFTFSAECPNPDCKKQADWEVDLSNKEDFPIKRYKDGKERIVEYCSKMIPNLKIKFSHLNGHAEMIVLRKRNNLNALTDLELRTPQAWQPKAPTVPGGHEGTWVPIQLSRLPDRLISEMRKVIKEYEGAIETSVKLICAHCESEVTFDLLMQQDFMTPNVTS